MEKTKKWRTVQNVRICREIPCFDCFGMCSLRNQYHFIYAAFCLHLARHPRFNPAFAAGDISLATGSAHYAWMAVVFAAASILIYFIAELYSSGGISYSHQI